MWSLLQEIKRDYYSDFSSFFRSTRRSIRLLIRFVTKLGSCTTWSKGIYKDYTYWTIESHFTKFTNCCFVFKFWRYFGNFDVISDFVTLYPNVRMYKMMCYVRICDAISEINFVSSFRWFLAKLPLVCYLVPQGRHWLMLFSSCCSP